LKPKRFKAFLEYTLHKFMNEPVSIGDARLRFENGLLVTIKDFSMGRHEVMHMDVKKIDALFSPLKILTRKPNALSLQLDRPEVYVYIESFMDSETTGLTLLPSVGIKNGSVKAVYKEKTFLLDRIDGQISANTISLSTTILDGRANIYAKKTDGKWIGKTEAAKLILDKLECNIKGNIDIIAGIEEQDKGFNVSLLFSAEDIDLPGNGKIIQQARLMIDFGGSGDIIQFREINLKTNTLTLSGMGNLDLARGDSIGDALLNIKLGSNRLDYEALVEYLPSDLCPDWLPPLLLKQVRNGNLEISLLEYNGHLKTFTGSFYNNLYIKAGLDGMSYGAGHNNDRITGVTGTVYFEKGDLSFKNISGIAGDSTITSVDLILPDIAADGLRLIVNTDLEVKAKDFAKIWRAAMEPKEVFDLMAPLSNVTSGSIKAKVSYKEGFEGSLPHIMGTIHLDDCSFLWSDFSLENFSGSASADAFGLPFTINMSGKFNSLPITNLTLNLSDPLRQQVYDYTLITSGPKLNGFRLNNGSSITIKGKGKGPDFYGDISVFSKGFELGGKQYIPFGNRINGSGKITGTLWPESMLKMTGIKLPMGSANLNLQMILKKIGGNIKMNGTINARQAGVSSSASAQEKMLMGGIDMILAWGEGLPSSGSIKLDKMTFFYNESMLVVNGPITVSGSLLSSKHLDIIQDIDTKIKLSGRLELSDQNNHFTGDISVDGFKVKPAESSGFQLPESLTGEADILISNLNLMGFPFEKASMKADLKKEILFLKSIQCGGEYGTLSGGAEFSKKKGNRFIVDIDLKNKGLEDLFTSLYSNKFLIDGYLHLKGRIYGTTDNINGNLVFSARDGHIFKSSFLSKLFGSVNLYKIIKSRHLDLREKRFSYNKILSSFDIKDNLMTFDDFYLDSNSVQFSAIGSYNLETKVVDSTIGVQPLETLDLAVSVIPVIGWVLTGEGKKLFVISFSATGDISNPKIDLAPSSTISQPASDTLIRILDLPERLIDKSGNMLPGLKK